MNDDKEPIGISTRKGIDPLAIVFPNSYGKHLRDKAGSETYDDKEGMVTKKSSRAAVTTQTVDKAYARLASVKTSIQKIGDYKLVDSKLSPEQAAQKYDLALGAIDVCREELSKLAKTLKRRKQALTIAPEPTNKEGKATTPKSREQAGNVTPEPATVQPVSDDRKVAA